MSSRVAPTGWPLFSVEIYGFDAVIYTAPTRDKARWRAYVDFSGVYQSTTFADFLAKGVRVRETDAPSDDGYDNVRAQYGVSPKLGERLILQGEGPNDGREVTVIYPGRRTSMIHAYYDGEDRALLIHPMNVRRP